MSGPMNSHSITDYILKLEKENSELRKEFIESEIQRVGTTLNEAEESRTKIKQLKKLLDEANEEKVDALNELNDLKYKNRSLFETTARVGIKTPYSKRLVNVGIVERLTELGRMTSDFHKTATYQNAATTVADLSYQVESGESLMHLNGIGSGIAAKINEYLDELDSDYEESDCSDSESIASNGDDEDVNNFSEDDCSEDGSSTDSAYFVSYNIGISDMLYNLADDTDDKFKRDAYFRAASSIYELPYKVVNGMKISEGPNKVHGVGKSIAKKIDEYLKTCFDESENEVSDSECWVSSNPKLTDIFDKLASQETDVHKKDAYQTAADMIHGLGFSVTSGKELSAGPNKVKGIGKSVAIIIDEFLVTGAVKKLESVSTNAEIVIALTYLANDTEDHFKARAFRNAANSIRDLDFEVTSGEELCTGPNKVSGIGKKIAKRIDQFIQTGSIA